MCEKDKLDEALVELGTALRQRPSRKEQIMQCVMSSALSETLPARWYRTRRVKALASLAACLALVAALWAVLGGNGATEAFASAIQSLQNARTFYAIQTSTTSRDGAPQVHVMTFAFQEPDLERFEYNAGFELAPEINVRDYGRKRHLTLFPAKKEAIVYDMSHNYAIDEPTGQLRPSRLSTELREDLLDASAKAVQDLGETELDGQRVRVLQGRKGKCLTTVWVEPGGGLPVQIAFERGGSKMVYSGIQIDRPLDPALFRTEVPEGYSLFRNGVVTPAPDYYAKMLTKIMFVGRHVHCYASKHDDQFPVSLDEVVADGCVAEQTLKTVLAPPDQPEGPPVIVYRRPRPDAPSGQEIMLYEAPAQRRDGKVAVGMADGHAEVLPQERFDALMR